MLFAPKCSPEENKFVFDNLALLRKEFRDASTNKRDLDSILSDSIGLTEIIDENLSPRKKGSLSKNLFSDDSVDSRPLESTVRPPLLPIDMNAITNPSTNEQNKNKSATVIGSNRQQKRNERTIRMMKEKQNKSKNGSSSNMCDASSLTKGNECAIIGST
jgi:hypothetical protein